MSQAAIELPGTGPRERATVPAIRLRRLAFAALLGVVIGWLVGEAHSSRTQARLFHSLAASMRFETARPHPLPAVSAVPGAIAAPSISATSTSTPTSLELVRSPHDGPYDQRLGHDRVSELASRALARGFVVERTARHSDSLRIAHQMGLAAPYREKPQSGLRVLGRDGMPLFESAWPERVYERFDEIPSPIVSALLFVENRELLEPGRPSRNPVLEWDRLALAAIAYPLNQIDASGHPFGGSTLATQIQKFRHSPGGRTGSLADKLRQIVSASLQIYRSGEDTTAARRGVVLDYLNGVPLAAYPGYGEVIGVPDGLRIWMGADFERVNELLRTETDDPMLFAERGRAFRQVLSLILAAQRPSFFLRKSPLDLEQRTETYLQLMATEGIISPRLIIGARAAGRTPISLDRSTRSTGTELDLEAAAPIRSALVPLLGETHYEIDRLDLIADTTVDVRAQREVGQLLHSLGDPQVARELGLIGPRMLGQGDPASVTYSLSLFERAGGRSLLRVQTDNLAGPFDVNDGARMDLGSTAKLRTLISYLEIIAQSHAAYAGLAQQDLVALEIDPSDVLARWVVERLVARPDTSLEALLDESLERRYSASPWEGFYTGGGLHHFENFDREDNERILTLREAFRRSVNLVFIRLMRDVTAHHVAALVTNPTSLLDDVTDPRRRSYLERHAENEGRLHIDQYLRRHRGKSADESLDLLLPKTRRTPKRLAAVLLYLEPAASLPEFSAAMAAHGVPVTDADAEQYYGKYSIDRFDLSDRSYIAHVHPMELWLVAHLRRQPEDTRSAIMTASQQAREESTAWLFRTRRKGVTNRAIRIALEQQAFGEIHRSWQRLGYPFGDLVPSYATAIGSSGDRPAALAELMGILAADGVREPSIRIERLRFAEGTPFETILAAEPSPPVQVLAPEIARATRRLLVDVVQNGTAIRARGSIRAADGSELVIGGKTGTGDNRLERFGRDGRVIASEFRSRTATFAFMLGDRFYGVVTASVTGPQSENYAFTSSLPVALLGVVSPIFERTIAAAQPPGLQASR